MKKPRESLLEKRVTDEIKSMPGAWIEKISQRSIRGTPDRLACINGRFVALEFKRSSVLKPRGIQKLKLERIAESGGIARVVYPENADEVLKELWALSRSESF